jgi:hypothetical protein
MKMSEKKIMSTKRLIRNSKSILIVVSLVLVKKAVSKGVTEAVKNNKHRAIASHFLRKLELGSRALKKDFLIICT